MKVTEEYLNTLPKWLMLALKERDLKEVYDFEKDWKVPWAKISNTQIIWTTPEPTLLELSDEGTTITTVLNGEVITFANPRKVSGEGSIR